MRYGQPTNRLELLISILNASIHPLLPFDQERNQRLFERLARLPLTVDCLLRLTLNPWNPKTIEHPALRQVALETEEIRFQLYLRVNMTTKGRLSTHVQALRVSQAS